MLQMRPTILNLAMTLTLDVIFNSYISRENVQLPWNEILTNLLNANPQIWPSILNSTMSITLKIFTTVSLKYDHHF